MGRLSLVNNEQGAVVVGGGPAGSFCAFELAKRGVDVSVLEEHEEIGVPSHCAGHMSIRSLRSLGLYPLPEGIVENTFSAANFYSPKGTKFSVRLANPVTCAVNRSLFDRYLADKARAAGAHYFLKSRVESLIIEGDFVKGVNVVQEGNLQTHAVSANMVVDAEGVSSRLLHQAGLPPLDGDKLVYAVEAEVENIKDVQEHTVEVYLGKNYAPGFYGWLMPRPNGTAKVGLATKRGNPKHFLDRLMRQHPVASRQLRTAKVKSMIFHAIPLGGPIQKAYRNGFLAVGDCASQVKPTTGGGVIFSITCAKIAAEVAAKAVEKPDLSEGFLHSYQKRLMNSIGFDVEVMLGARHVLDRFSDEKIDGALRFAAKTDLGDALRNVEEIDFQGRTLLTMLRKPAVFATIIYIASIYLLQKCKG